MLCLQNEQLLFSSWDAGAVYTVGSKGRTGFIGRMATNSSITDLSCRALADVGSESLCMDSGMLLHMSTGVCHQGPRRASATLSINKNWSLVKSLQARWMCVTFNSITSCEHSWAGSSQPPPCQCATLLITGRRRKRLLVCLQWAELMERNDIYIWTGQRNKVGTPPPILENQECYWVYTTCSTF